MKKEEKIQRIRERCVEANPKIQDRIYCCKYQTFDRGEFCDVCLQKRDPINIADILLAIGSMDRVGRYGAESIGITGIMFNVAYSGNLHGYFEWGLRAEDLREQSEETINFLYTLLN